MQRFPHNHAQMAKYLPIAPSPAALTSRPQLKMDWKPLQKESYVNISETYKVHVRMLRLYDTAYPTSYYKLSRLSLGLVMLERDSLRRVSLDSNKLQRNWRSRDALIASSYPLTSSCAG